MNIYLGADHNGFELKKKIGAYLRQCGYVVVDDGDNVLDTRDDYPQFGARVVTSLLADKDVESRGILICGSGQGICIAANRYKGIRAAICWNIDEARNSRNDDDCNILCLSARYQTFDEITPIISTFLNTPFAGASRFKRRIKELDELG